MILTVTNAGLTYIRNKIQSGSPPDIKHFVLAHVPNVMAAGLNADSGMPDQSRIVHKQDVTRLGKIDADTVVFSLFMGADVGNFVFNWIGLLASDNTLIGFSISGEQNKYKTEIKQSGNNLRRNIILKFAGAAETLSVKIPAATWQQDISHLLDQKIDKTSISDKLDLDDPTKVSSSKAIKVLKDGLDKRIAEFQQWRNSLTGNDADNIVNKIEEIKSLLASMPENADLLNLLNNIDAGRIKSGVLSEKIIPNLNASKITNGEFKVEQLPKVATQAWWKLPGEGIGQIIPALVDPGNYLKYYPLCLPCNGGEINIKDYQLYADYYAPVGASGRVLSPLAIRLGLGLNNSTGKITLPNFRNEPFLRMGLSDIATFQSDAIKNIVGEFYSTSYEILLTGSSGPFTLLTKNTHAIENRSHIKSYVSGVRFDASRVVTTANENRPKNRKFLALVKVK